MIADKKAEAIRALTAAGFALFPLSGNSKIPRAGFDDWGSTPVGKYGVKELANCNYGIVLGPNDIVVDVDPRNFLPGDNPLKRLADAVGVPLDSFTVQTGSGGLHIFFKITTPEGMVIVGNLKKKGFLGIDTKHAGGYVLGAGSIHPDTGRPYQIVRRSPDEIMPAAKGLVDLVVRPEQDPLSTGTGEFIDDEQTRKRYISYLTEKAPPSIEGHGGDANAFVVAARARDFALPAEVALELMLEHWNEQCVPPWSEAQLRDKVRHAYRYASNPIGAAHPAAEFKASPLPVEQPKPVARPLAPSVVALQELMSPDSEPQPKIPGATLPDSDTRPLSDVATDDVDWAMSANGSVLKNFQNLLNYLKAKTGTGLTGIFVYNEFACEAQFGSPAPWHRGMMPHSPSLTDADLKHLKAHLAVRHTMERSVTEIEEAVTVIASAKRFHPVREYLKSLKWDGVPRLDFWLRDHLGVEDSELTRAIARKTLCAAVMRVMKPGCKFDYALFLEGDQGIGKSTVCEILGGEWAADFEVDPSNKDTVQYMQGKWIIELADLQNYKTADINTWKAFITRRRDRVRLAYGRLAVDYPRQSIFIGSFNPGPDGTYLKDDTGNRRFWTVRCNPTGPNGKMDFRKFKEARNQLWAEAFHRVSTNGGELLYLETPELEGAMTVAVAMRHAEHPWTERIGSWLDSLKPRRDFVTAREVFIDALQGIDKQLDTRSTRSIASALKSLGWKPDTNRHGNGRPVRGYKRIETRTPQQIADDLNAQPMVVGVEDIENLEHALVGSGLI